eukprot:2567840-Pyramimonas_sp.AAC.1
MPTPVLGSPVLSRRHGVINGAHPWLAHHERAFSNCSPSSRNSCAATILASPAPSSKNVWNELQHDPLKVAVPIRGRLDPRRAR